MISKRYIHILLVLELFQGIYFCELRANFFLCAVNEYLINKSNECFASAVAILNSVWKSSERIKFNSIENFQFYSYKSELKLALSTRTKKVIWEQSIVQQIWTVGNSNMSNDRPNTFEQLHPFICISILLRKKLKWLHYYKKGVGSLFEKILPHNSLSAGHWLTFGYFFAQFLINLSKRASSRLGTH